MRRRGSFDERRADLTEPRERQRLSARRHLAPRASLERVIRRLPTRAHPALEQRLPNIDPTFSQFWPWALIGDS